MIEKVVFTDIDGTLLNGFITFDFAKYLNKCSEYNELAYKRQIDILKKFELGEMNYLTAVQEWLHEWGKGVDGKQVNQINKLAKQFFQSYRGSICNSSKILIETLKKKGYYVVGVSAGVDVMMSLVKDYLGLDEIFASKLFNKNGIYLPKLETNLHKVNGKKETLEKFIIDKEVMLKNSIAFGDSLHDLDLFNLAEIKIALNPTKDLERYAKLNKFIVVNENNVLNIVNSMLTD